jgi:predicted SprT family Zn-dependent metalloprotease
MHVDEARAMAESLMAQHGLVGWRLVLDRARTRAGVCRPARREIGLSRVLTELHSAGEVRETVLHEVAHALVGSAHGHDAVWRATARAIGATGERCVAPDAARAPAPWVGRCPAGHEVRRYRRPQRVTSCPRCARSFDLGALFTWRLHGQVVAMGPRYTAELGRLAHHRAAGPVAASAGG